VELGDGELRSDMTVMVERYRAPFYGCNDADEIGEMFQVVG
jgi:hypothetical protein